MAKFLRLHIRGIRSVGDEDHDVHKIDFLSPCTLISGPNGTGKTTTIEALNFVTTGQMPTQKKQNFIHSTDVARKTRVDASVTLEFIDVKGRECTAVRRLVVTSGTKAAALAEEHTLAIKYPDGTVNTLSSKVCDFNTALLKHLGVPRAVFKYVIFCHQEDSTWPLSEPKELKKRFDDIFQLTKFVKAQERMKKIVLDFKKEMQTHEMSKQLYETHVRDKLVARQNQEECERKISKRKEETDELKERKANGQKKIEEMRTSIHELEDTLTSFKKTELERQNLKKQLSLIRVEPYFGTEEELKREIEEFRGSEGRSYGEERARIQKKIGKNNQERQELSQKKTEFENRISSLKAEVIHCQSLKYDLERLENQLRSELDLEHDADIDIEIDNAITLKIRGMSDKARMIAKNCAELQSNLRTAQEAATKIEVEMKTLQNEKVKLEKEVEQLKFKIKQGQNATAGMKDLLKKEEALRKSLADLPLLDENALTECKLKREKYLKQLDILKKKCAEAEKNAEKDREKESLKQTLSIARKKMTAYQRIYDNNWQGLIGQAPDFPWTPILSKTFHKLRNDKKIMEEDLRDVQLNVQKLETMQHQYRKQEESLTAQELKLSENIFEACSCEAEEVSEKLENLRKRLKKARKDLAPLSAKSNLYDSYIEESKSSGCCPLCDRDFKTKKEINEFSKKLENMTLSFPTEQEELEKLVSKLEKEEIIIVKAEGQANELQRIVKELKEVREKNRKLSTEMAEEKSNLSKNEKQLETVNAKLKLAEDLQTDVGVIQQLYEQTEENEKRYEQLVSESDSSDGLSYTELRKKVEDKDEEYRKIVQEGEELQKCSEERNKLQSKLNELGTHRVSLGEAAAQAGAFAEQLETKIKEIQECITAISQKRNEDLPDAQFKKDDLTRNVSSKEEEKKKAEMEVQMMKKELDQKIFHRKSLFKKVQEGGLCERQLMDKENNIATLNASLEENQQRQKRFEEDLRSFDSSHQRESILKDQLTRMIIENKIKELKRTLATFDGQINEDRITEQKQAYNKLQNELRLIGNEEVKIYTQMQEYEKQKKIAEAKLSTKECQNAESNYRDAIIELAITKESISDLTKYRNCLDASLIQFHSEKMGRVNGIIDDLWRKVYNSTDITTIRIRSDATSETSSKKVAYEYNVMMVHETGTEVEMRGRCSAGQKMLASLLIRIALAEVFGGSCSMIALDEPTTNLDESKVEGMAIVLADIIAERRGFDENGKLRGRDMQMVVITHDERLVNRITISCRPEYIYCLGKDEHGISFLSKRYPDGTVKRVNTKRRF
ncbi:DNA repair protein rad-50 [Caenorhabditis elegans]|uniref:DNA repair protein rad-50 n=2 Tax=Caenorhabditis elegans TaxID=6239 RepID=RAD50_CAEEL|nr:DNA repair protein rad-50 [Caenorhabditis elegans]O44199.1 RecName: Full=DNA repair protein rad-50 [Caenorhabditis elegans]CAA99730.1 RAD50 homologue ceRAD50 [Caenorhabditis elegans]CAB01581.1 DNA repair protein rad-50 [Caenorhabditis elegans]|eukprot:NP_506070.1 DNA repair protein rad-50 [Caenorhabditis elegans]